ncbi:MAG: CocE/NonD family hydrolase C-terminal non-catalytic domain-containing protein [Selenomonadaceae bacterium]|nr:CocE/NonD family hydrolase C-terminal non-catalytic domain-containing protein [Selenomonadaceae bacterium]
MHNTNEWADYYQPEHVEDLRKFFDHYLKGVANDWEKTPRVRLLVLDPGHKDVVDRVEQEFPLARTQYKKLYLTGQQTLSWGKAAQEQVVSYDTQAERSAADFVLTFDQDTELTGYMNLHTYVEADGAEDMELQVTVQKLDKDGKVIADPMTHMPIVSEGYLRVSQRALDKQKSTPAEPVLKHTHEDLLQKGEIVPVDIGIWPMGMKYHAGEKLQLTIAAYQPPKADSVPPFGVAKIAVPEKGDTFMPGEKSAMKILGGNHTEVTYPNLAVKAPATRNKGKHIIHVGGKYDSYLLVPVVPEK